MPVEQGDLYWEKRSVIGFPLRAILRALQCTFAIATAVLYGLDLASATDRRVTPGSGWIYAEVVSGLSLLGCLSHLVFTMTKCRWSLVDWVIFILWVAQFGVFGTIFLGSPSLDRGGSYSDHNRMLAAVWVDMVNMLLWFASGCISLVKCCAARRHQKQQRDTINMKVENLESDRIPDTTSRAISSSSFPPVSPKSVPRSPPPKYSFSCLEPGAMSPLVKKVSCVESQEDNEKQAHGREPSSKTMVEKPAVLPQL